MALRVDDVRLAPKQRFHGRRGLVGAGSEKALRRGAASRPSAVGEHRCRRPAGFHRHRTRGQSGRLEGLCHPLDRAVLISGAFAETTVPPHPAWNSRIARHRRALRGVYGAEISRPRGPKPVHGRESYAPCLGTLVS